MSHPRLLRDFIKNSLYNLHQGYFSSQIPVGFLQKPIDFPSLQGKSAYLSAVQRHYNDLQVHWLTPVEIFSPHLGASIANYLTKQHNNTHHPLRIYEIGGGSGTLAKDILTWMSHNTPDIHHSCRYTVIEISHMLADLQWKRVTQNGSVHTTQFDVVHGDALDPGVWGSKPSDEPCFIVAMEVFDNLPHDKVFRNGSSGSDDEWYETLVVEKKQPISNNNSNTKDNNNHMYYEEESRRLQDTLIHRCLHTWLKINNNNNTTNNTSSSSSAILSMIQRMMSNTLGESIFLPTCALQLFDTIHRMRPMHRIVGADFDYLPETIIDGVNAPLVATTVGGSTIDHSTYLVPEGTADIFFPTDFELLTALYNDSRQASTTNSAYQHDAGDNETRYMKAGVFFKEWAPDKAATCTQDGYDPLLSDYSNTSVLLS